MPVLLPLGHRFSPQDRELLDRVHWTITAHAEKFKQAAADLDARYSVDRLRERDPEKFAGEEWTPRARRFIQAVHDLHPGSSISHDAPSWIGAAYALLVTWIAFDDRANGEPLLSDFQCWPWSSGDSGFPRAMAHVWLHGYVPFLLAGAYDTLTLARQRGLAIDPATAPVQAPAAPPRKVSASRLPVLTKQARVFRDIFLARPPHEPILGSAACDEYYKNTNQFVDEPAFRTRIVPVLKRWGLKNIPRVGYWFPENARARQGG